MSGIATCVRARGAWQEPSPKLGDLSISPPSTAGVDKAGKRNPVSIRLLKLAPLSTAPSPSLPNIFAASNRERAYEIWNAGGRIHGQADQHWLAAEREILPQLSAETPASPPLTVAKVVR